MDLIEQFVSRYVREIDFYEQAARIAARWLEASLQAEGIRCIVTSRAKSPNSLEAKARQRHKDKKPYTTADDIYSDIVDLAGVRVALYFPGEVEQAGRIVARTFTEFAERKVFAGAAFDSPTKRFGGYSATHYRVRLPSTEATEFDPRYASANIEVQVASVLMHAWSEVEHDLVYKPYGGDLSPAERSLLDQLNGLVMAGEISLEQLQQAGKQRVAQGGRSFANHYELAAHILANVGGIAGAEGKSISDEGLGRIDLLFDMLGELDIKTPDALRPYLDTIHGDIERRPLAEQVIDALLAEDSGRYEIYRSIRASVASSNAAKRPRDERYAEVGFFLTQWVRLEQLIRMLNHSATPGSGTGNLPPMSARGIQRTLERIGIRSEDGLVFELDSLRRIRNMLVHGIETPSPAVLSEAGERIERLIEEIDRRRRLPDATAEDVADAG